jgi:SAM-dependent methyltransferase
MTPKLTQIFTLFRSRSAPSDSAKPRVVDGLEMPLHANSGFCPICEQQVTFNAWSDHLRDTYLCDHCGTIPRERAIMVAMDKFFPNWRELSVHESSPAQRGVSKKLLKECPGYVPTQYHPSIAEGSIHPVEGWRCENLERQTFPDASFDLVITQDVLEHIFNPDAAFREIARTLKPGGAHIATTPMVRGPLPSIVCAEIDVNGVVRHLQPPDYHGNPVDDRGSLVTFWWGYDLAERIDRVAPFNTLIWLLQDQSRGVDGPLNEVLVSFRTSPTV